MASFLPVNMFILSFLHLPEFLHCFISLTMLLFENPSVADVNILFYPKSLVSLRTLITIIDPAFCFFLPYPQCGNATMALSLTLFAFICNLSHPYILRF